MLAVEEVGVSVAGCQEMMLGSVSEHAQWEWAWPGCTGVVAERGEEEEGCVLKESTSPPAP